MLRTLMVSLALLTLVACGSAQAATSQAITLTVQSTQGDSRFSLPDIHHSALAPDGLLEHIKSLPQTQPMPCTFDYGYHLALTFTQANGQEIWQGDVLPFGCSFLSANNHLYMTDALFWSRLSQFVGQTLPPPTPTIS